MPSPDAWHLFRLTDCGEAELTQHHVARLAKHCERDHERDEIQHRPIGDFHGGDALVDGFISIDKLALGVGARLAIVITGFPYRAVDGDVR